MQALSVVASKLAKMHEAGWVHRDLKPGNVLRMPALHSWTLIDFGCSAYAGARPPLVLSHPSDIIVLSGVLISTCRVAQTRAMFPLAHTCVAWCAMLRCD